MVIYWNDLCSGSDVEAGRAWMRCVGHLLERMSLESSDAGRRMTADGSSWRSLLNVRSLGFGTCSNDSHHLMCSIALDRSG